MSGYRSEIRDSDIQYLEDKVNAGSYGSYLRRITLRRVRGFRDRVVSFDFPVTALVGPNGGGKSTILGAAGLIYKSIAPGTFFAKSGRYDANMTNSIIEYEVIDKDAQPPPPPSADGQLPAAEVEPQGDPAGRPVVRRVADRSGHGAQGAGQGGRQQVHRQERRSRSPARSSTPLRKSSARRCRAATGSPLTLRVRPPCSRRAIRMAPSTPSSISRQARPA